MNLRDEIDIELWEVVEKNYCNESYSSAIIDSIHLLSETIRNKTGLEGDGASLIGQAFGSDNPRIKINNLQTDSEKDAQKGIQEILRGIYSSIRNPRSHGKINDTKRDADAIVLFINYILNIINISKLSFDVESYLKLVFDEHYVKTNTYAELLVAEIPRRQRANIAISVILNRKRGDIYNLSYFLSAVFNSLDELEIDRVYKIISEELQLVDSEEEIRIFLKICPGKYWCKIKKLVKIRIENIILQSVISGRYDSEKKKCNFGSLGTWVTKEHLFNFEDQDIWTRTLVKKLTSDSESELLYVDKYFWNSLCIINRDNINYSIKNYIKKGLDSNNEFIKDKLKNILGWEEEHPWWQEFELELLKHPDIVVCDDLPW